MKRVSAQGGKLSNLEIDCYDSCFALLETESNHQISLSLNTYSREVARSLRFHSSAFTLELDFIKGRLIKYSEEGVATLRGLDDSTYDRNYSYREMHSSILCDRSIACTYKEGKGIDLLIEAIESSIAKRSWVTL